MSLIRELRRRNVFRAGAAYIVVSWLILQIADVLLGHIGTPAWVFSTLLVLLCIGLVPLLLFAWIFELTPEGLKREHEVDRSRSIARQTGRKLDYTLIGLLVIALAYFVWESRFRDEVTPVTGDGNAVPAAGDVSDERSIAVLPFVNMSADADNEYFSDGVTEELLSVLARLPELRVSSRTSSFAFKGRDASISTVAATLGVKHILEGSVRRAGQRVRITAQLIDAATDTRLWSQTYDRELEDIFEVQDDIAHEIVAALEVRLSSEEELKLETPRAASVEAYDYYLRGRGYWAAQGRQNLDQAREMFESAVEADPGYAPAVAWLAIYHASMYDFYETSEHHLQEADRWSERALALAPQLDQAHIARGQSLRVRGEYEQATQAFERALELNPRSADAMTYYGLSRYSQGDLDGAAAAWEQAIELQPDNFLALSLLPQVYRGLGQKDKERAIQPRIRNSLEQQLLARPDEVNLHLSLAQTYASMGQTEDAIALTDRMLPRAEGDALLLYNAACAYALAGAVDRAIAALEASYAAGMFDADWMQQDSDLDAVRDDPRFIALLERMNDRGVVR